MKKEMSEIVKSAYSYEQIIECINNGGTSSFSSNAIAGQYAANAAEDSDLSYDVVGDDLFSCHLDFLVEQGAAFDYRSALNVAKQYI